MRYLVLDTESTGAQRESKGSALDPRNILCYVGIVGLGGDLSPVALPIEYESGIPYADSILLIRRSIAACDVLVLFNAKHDLHWLRRYGIAVTCPIWDCQLAEFILNGQREPFPSLDNTSRKYGGDGKIDIVSNDYWGNGFDTNEVPREILESYLCGDILETERIFLGQIARLKDNQQLKRMIWLACQDELITQEMEWNGLHFDISGLLGHADTLDSRLISIDCDLAEVLGRSDINWGSPDQVSTILYGGELIFEHREPYLFYYKDARKPPKEKLRTIQEAVKFPRLVEPLPRSELASGGYSTEDKTLRKLKAFAKAKRIVDLILERRGIKTQITRYFRGIPKKYNEMGWQDELIHGQLHHCVAATGRLSSSNPNQQNLDERCRVYLKTRFK